MSVAIFPLDNFDISTHSLRWMWPLSAFISFAVLATVVRRVATAERRTWVTAGLAGAVVVVALLNLPASDQGGGPNSDVAAIPGAQELTRQVGGALDEEAPVLVDSLFLQRFGDPYGPTVLVGLDERGVDFVVEDPMLVGHFGTDRRADRGEAKSELLLRYGDEARTPPPGSEEVALIEGLDAAERREVADLRDEIAAHIESDGISLNDAGERALVAGSLPNVARQQPGPFDLDALFDSREISLLGASGWLDASEPVRRTFARYAELQSTADSQTVALFVRPRPGRG